MGEQIGGIDMAFQIELMRCTAEKERVNKASHIIGSWICQGTLKEDTSIVNPTILIAKSTPPPDNKYNYMRINAFGRYYFIKDIEVQHNGMWLIRAKCDVLYTYQTDILNSKVIIEKTEEDDKANLYYDDGSFVMDSRKYNQVIEFPSGLSQNGYNILICAGGI